MGILDSFSKGFKQGAERAHRKSYRRRTNDFPVKLVEPSVGRIVELEVTEPNDSIAELYKDQLIAYAQNLEKCGVQWEVTGKTVRLTFSDGDFAETARNNWKKV